MNRRIYTYIYSVIALLSCHNLCAETYYVRQDGGTAKQCDGKIDLPYSAKSKGKACAWQHLYYALPPNSDPRIGSGDTLIIGPGEYSIGWGAPGAAETNGRCYDGGRYDCYLPPIPSGPDSQRKTRILGTGHDTGCSAPPKLWGTERVTAIINLEGSSNIEIACLEITDKSDCVEFHVDPAVRCERDVAPYGDWASTGIAAANSKNVHLLDLNIHGLAGRGIRAGGLTDWTIERVKITANGWTGWDGDIGARSANRGQIVMRDIEIAWNGCGQRWQTGEIHGCWAQEGGGYGDGLGTAATGGVWLIEDALVHHNTSDGIDLLYLDGDADTSVTIRRAWVSANAGNQIKTHGNATIENSVVLGNCAYFLGKDKMQDADNCRAMGNAISVGLEDGRTVTLAHNTVMSEGDCLILSAGGGGSAQLNVYNNALLGQLDWRANQQGNTGELSCGHYADNSRAAAVFNNNLLWNVKNGQCMPDNLCDMPPALTDLRWESFDPEPLPDSPLIDQAQQLHKPPGDLKNRPRDHGSAPDIGAIESTTRPRKLNDRHS